MRAVVIHAPKDLKIEAFVNPPLGADDVRIKVATGGICGSDLHYYHHGGFGVVKIREPMALGHELAGVISDLGANVSHLSIGQRVAVNPSAPCGLCLYCRQGQHNHCLDMRFMGSAMRFPHVQGGFREELVIGATQAIPIADHLTMAEAAAAEPLAVCLHAAKQAGPLLGKRVLVTGSGPIGALTALVAKTGGAAEIVVTDIVDEPLAIARELGATRTINTAADASAFDVYKINKGAFDILFEASGNQHALRAALEVMRPGGIIVQLGLGGEMTLPFNAIVGKELQMRGTFRFDQEFALAVQMMGDGVIDVKPLITASLPFAQAAEAFELASDRSQSMKVQLTF